MMSCMFYLFPLQEKSDSEVLDFWIFSELAVLDWFLLEYLSSYTISTYDRVQFYWLQLAPCQNLSAIPFLNPTIIIVEHCPYNIRLGLQIP